MVVFYKYTGKKADVKLAGIYNTKEDAINRLHQLFGNFKEAIYNSVQSEDNIYTAWINKISIGDNSYHSIGMPINSIDLFNK